jgi:hypothetical protein
MKASNVTPIALMNVRQQIEVDPQCVVNFARPLQIKALGVGSVVTLYDSAGFPLIVRIKSHRGRGQFTGVILAAQNIRKRAHIAFHACNVSDIEWLCPRQSSPDRDAERKP